MHNMEFIRKDSRDRELLLVPILLISVDSNLCLSRYRMGNKTDFCCGELAPSGTYQHWEKSGDYITQQNRE